MIKPKELPPHLRIQYIVEVMKMRETGRKRLLSAIKRRRHRTAKKSSGNYHTYLGIVDDNDFGDWNFRQEEVCEKSQTIGLRKL